MSITISIIVEAINLKSHSNETLIMFTYYRPITRPCSDQSMISWLCTHIPHISSFPLWSILGYMIPYSPLIDRNLTVYFPLSSVRALPRLAPSKGRCVKSLSHKGALSHKLLKSQIVINSHSFLKGAIGQRVSNIIFYVGI